MESVALVLRLVAALVMPPAPTPAHEPNGLLDCAFDARNVYVCRPESPRDQQRHGG